MLRIAAGAPASRCFIGWRGVAQEIELWRRQLNDRAYGKTRQDAILNAYRIESKELIFN